MSEMLKVSDLHVYYGSIHAVKGVSFEVHEGEVVTLIGANGAGKSTILNTVSGLLHPRSGSILFHEKICTASPPTSWWAWAWPRFQRAAMSFCR